MKPIGNPPLKNSSAQKYPSTATSMYDLIQELWFLPRDLVSDAFDQALFRLAQEIPPNYSSARKDPSKRKDSSARKYSSAMSIHKYPTGEMCWTWRVPEKWTCHEAYLETLDGKRLIDWSNHPLHVISYSLPFDGIVSREELFRHLHIHPRIPDAIPYIFKYYERDWGLCASQTLKDALTEDSYRVVIRTTFEPGILKVGEVVVQGESQETFVLVAHLCHPGMVNDDLTGVVVGLEVIRSLLAMPKPYYTYRLLILPETIGSVAYLSHHENLIPDMVGGLFLEMLGNDSPHALQGSFQPLSQVDRCLFSAFRTLDPSGYTSPYRSVINNDERQFNAPGVRVPMLSISRVEPPESPTRPYREYHTSFDTPAIISQDRLENSRNLILGFIQAFERNQFLVNQFKGEIFCSGYGIWIDYRQNPEGHRRLFEIMERCDGEHTLADISSELMISYQSVWEIANMLYSKGLVKYSRKPQSTDPHQRKL